MKQIPAMSWLLLFVQLKEGFSSSLLFLPDSHDGVREGVRRPPLTPRMKMQQCWSRPAVTRGGALAAFS